jgi:NADP-dependent 3-hydroxy acid dehydrogenase YdfG
MRKVQLQQFYSFKGIIMSKVILITGTSTGFGRDTAETLHQAGHIVFASMRDPEVKNKEHADALIALGVHVIALDVTSTSSIEQAVNHVIQTSGKIDVLINNAGVAAAGVTEAFNDVQAAALFDVNVIGVHRVTRAVLPTFRQHNDGLVINIGSILGRITFPFFGLYGASKYALEALTDSLHYEVSQLGIDVALIQPSAYPTNMYASCIQPVDDDRITEYGSVGEIPSAMFQHFTEMFESSEAPKPHDIATAILTLINTNKGQRPLRTVVGTSFGADLLNNLIEPAQLNAVKALGLDHLDNIRLS